MSISSQTVVAGPFTANGATTAFPFTIQGISEDELIVYQDGEAISSALYSVALTSTGGTVTYTSAPANGVEIYIVSDPAFESPLAITDNGAFNPSDVEGALDRGVARDLLLKAGLDKLLPDGALLPGAGAGKFAGFDAMGLPTFLSGTGADDGLRDDLADSGVGPDLIAIKQSGTGAVDRTVGDELGERITPLQFGAAGDGVTDDLTAINAAATYAQSVGGSLIFPKGYTFLISSYISIINGVRAVIGEGALIKVTGGGDAGLLLRGKVGGTSANVSGCRVSGLIIDLNGSTGFGVYGQNCVGCTITQNRIIGAGSAQAGILIRSFDAGTEAARDNVITDNYVDGTGNTTSSGIQCDASPTGTYPCVDNVVANNRILGFQYGVSLVIATGTVVTGNRISSPTRGISLQGAADRNLVALNVITGSASSGIHLNGSSRNIVSGNSVYSTSSSSEGLIQCYNEAKYNLASGNQIYATGTAQYMLYAASEADGNQFIGNHLYGTVAKAYIAVESAWRYDNPAALPAQYSIYARGYSNNGATNAASTGMSGVVIEGNRIEGTSNVPAIALMQLTVSAVDYALTGIVVQNNTIIGNSYSHQLYLYEEGAAALSTVIAKNNAFNPTSAASKYALPRGRAHFSIRAGNGLIDDNPTVIAFTASDATPSVGIGKNFVGGNTGTINITMFDDGADGQEIVYRGDGFSVLKHDGTKIKLRGAADATPTADQIVTLKRFAGVWIETARNF